MVKDWSLKGMSGLNDEQVKDEQAEIEGIMTKEEKDCVGQTEKKTGYMVEESHGQPVVYNGNEQKGG